MIVTIDEYIKLIARYMANPERDKDYIYESVTWMLNKIYKDEPSFDATMPNILKDYSQVIEHAQEEEEWKK